MNFGSDGILIFRSNISKHVGGGKKGERKNIDRSIRLLYRILLFLVQRITWKMDGSFGDYYRRGQKEGGKNGEGILRNPNVTPIFIMSLSREIFSVENGITNW